MLWLYRPKLQHLKTMAAASLSKMLAGITILILQSPSWETTKWILTRRIPAAKDSQLPFSLVAILVLKQ